MLLLLVLFDFFTKHNKIELEIEDWESLHYIFNQVCKWYNLNEDTKKCEISAEFSISPTHPPSGMRWKLKQT